MSIKKAETEGCFDKLSDDERKIVIEIASNFYYRTGIKNYDGTIGVIKITPGELNNALAFAIRYYEMERL